MATKIDNFVKQLALTDTGDMLFNPYNQLNKALDDRTAPGVRQQNLRMYLRSHAKLRTKIFWVYFSPTYQESRKSGIPLINSSLFKKAQNILDINKPFEKATKSKTKPSNTFLSRALWNAAQDLEINPIIWPVIPFFAHKKDAITKKRKPKVAEIEKYGFILKDLINMYKPKHIFAIGKEAEDALKRLEIKAIDLPHPRKGREKFKKLVSKKL